MPELADVEGFRRRLADELPGRVVRGVSAPAPEVVRNTSPQGLGRALHGKQLAAPWRHGKWLGLPTEDGPSVLLHFGMTGAPEIRPPNAPRHEHDRVVLRLDDEAGELRVHMARKLGGVWLARDEDERWAVTGPLGPDALSVRRDELAALLEGRRATLKAALMDQEVLAGLGNLLADEIAWRARVQPARKTADLSDEEVRALHRALRWVLPRAADAGCVPPRRGWLTGAREAEDPRCPRCGARLRRRTVAGRTTLWCPLCQPG